MPLTSIVELTDVLTHLGRTSDITDAEETLLSQLKAAVEQRVRLYLGSSITQEAAQTVFLPKVNAIDALWNNSQYTSYSAAYAGAILKLPDWPVRTVTSVYEDRGGYSGQGTNAFSSDALLTEGKDYAWDEDPDGFSRSGYLIRLGNSWPATPRSVKVTFTAGWTADELCGQVTDPKLDASAIRQAVITEFAEQFVFIKREQAQAGDNSGAAGPLLSERLGDYSATYANVMESLQKFEQKRGPQKLGDAAARWLAPWGKRSKSWVSAGE